MGNGWLTMFFFYMGVGAAAFLVLAVACLVVRTAWFYLVIYPILWVRYLLQRAELI